MCDNCIEQNPKFYNGGTVHVETQTHTGHTITLEFVVREPICDTCLFKIIKELVHNVSQEPQKVETELAEARAEIEKQDTLLEKCLSLLKQQKERG